MEAALHWALIMHATLGNKLVSKVPNTHSVYC